APLPMEGAIVPASRRSLRMAVATRLVDRCFVRLGLLDPKGTARANGLVLAGMFAFHLLALLACIPWLFTWSGLAAAFVAYYLFGVLGINVGYHRLLTHRGFSCPRWLEHVLAVLG